MRTHGAVVGRRFRSFTKLTTKVRIGRGYLWGRFLIAAAALKTPTRNGYTAQDVNLKFATKHTTSGKTLVCATHYVHMQVDFSTIYMLVYAVCMIDSNTRDTLLHIPWVGYTQTVHTPQANQHTRTRN